MKSKLIAASLFIATIATVILLPTLQTLSSADQVEPQTPPVVVPQIIDPLINHQINQQARIDVVFVLDTTGSMSGLIQAAKEKIWSIANTMASAQQAPEIRMGLVAYRDRGDDYVTQHFDLSSDLDSIYAQLMEFEADGGGDGPESVNQALHEAVSQMSWSQQKNTYKVVFLVGDAPPHMDYQDDVKYPVTLAEAAQRGIVVNAIQCGQQSNTLLQWQQIATLGGGDYFQVDQSGSAVAIATPFDKEMADLSAKLDQTRLYYGDAKKRVRQEKKLAASDKLHASSSVESRARRATYNLSKSGNSNFLGEGELVDDIDSGRVVISSIDEAYLPEPMKAMAPAQREQVIAQKAKQRKELKAQIEVLAEQRSSFLRKKVEEAGGAKDSLDQKIFEAVRSQAAEVGMSYEADAPEY